MVSEHLYKYQMRELGGVKIEKGRRILAASAVNRKIAVLLFGCHQPCNEGTHETEDG